MFKKFLEWAKNTNVAISLFKSIYWLFSVKGAIASGAFAVISILLAFLSPIIDVIGIGGFIVGTLILTLIVIILIFHAYEFIWPVFKPDSPANEYTKHLGRYLDFLESSKPEETTERPPILVQLLRPPASYEAYWFLDNYKSALNPNNPLKEKLHILLSYAVANYSDSSGFGIRNKYTIIKTEAFKEVSTQNLKKLVSEIHKRFEKIPDASKI